MVLMRYADKSLYSIRDGRVIANTQPAVTQIQLEQAEIINYGYSDRTK